MKQRRMKEEDERTIISLSITTKPLSNIKNHLYKPLIKLHIRPLRRVWHFRFLIPRRFRSEETDPGDDFPVIPLSLHLPQPLPTSLPSFLSSSPISRLSQSRTIRREAKSEKKIETRKMKEAKAKGLLTHLQQSSNSSPHSSLSASQQHLSDTQRDHHLRLLHIQI